MNGLAQTLRNLGPVRLAAMGIVAAATIGFFVFLTTRLATPGYGLLYSNLDLRDSGQIVQKLEAMNVPYQLRGDGAQILVPQDQVARVRMAMAEQGLPNGGSVGYEIFDKSDAFGTSSFVQNINQVRALEGELARTIGSLSPVQSARVHLVLPRRELFSRERQEPSASIVLKMRGAERLDKRQVAAVQHLVASAVPDLKANRVSIVDSDGNLLARGGGDQGNAFSNTTAEEARINYESRLSHSVEELLERSVGPGKARVDVHVDMDFDRITTNSETYDPNGQVVRSTQTVTDKSDSNESNPQSVTVSNNLPNSQTQSNGGATKSNSAHNEETTNYEISKTVRSQVREAGVVHRLSVAVLVDGTYSTGADGARTYQPRSPEEMKQLTTLVRSAVGYDEKRGDTVEVVNLRFAGADDVAAAPAPDTILGFDRADVLRFGETLVLALVAVLVILLVVRPLINRMLESAATTGGGSELGNLLSGGGAAAPALPAPASLGLSGPVAAAAGTALATAGAQGGLPDTGEMIDIGQVEGRVAASSIRKISEIVDKHPEEAVAIVRSWMYQGT